MLSMLLLQEHIFNSVKVIVLFGTFKLCITWSVISVIMWQLHFFSFLKHVFSIILEVCYLYVLTTYVDTIQLLRILGPNFWITFFVVPLQNALK